MMLEQLESRGRLNVLDAGSGSQSTVDFFAEHSARIQFADLFSCEIVREVPEDIDAGSAAEIFRRYLNLPENLVFDVCLFWDAFHHMDLRLLEGLSRALAPHFDARTLGYGFGSLHHGARKAERKAMAQERYRFGILKGSHLLLRPDASSGPYHAHTQQELTEHFPALTIQRATLLQEGRLELLLGHT